jgi:hypothetical protein
MPDLGIRFFRLPASELRVRPFGVMTVPLRWVSSGRGNGGTSQDRVVRMGGDGVEVRGPQVGDRCGRFGDSACGIWLLKTTGSSHIPQPRDRRSAETGPRLRVTAVMAGPAGRAGHTHVSTVTGLTVDGGGRGRRPGQGVTRSPIAAARRCAVRCRVRESGRRHTPGPYAELGIGSTVTA